MSYSRQPSTIRTTLSLPADLLEATDQAVRAGSVRSRNEFVAMALRHELAAQKRLVLSNSAVVA